MKCDVGASKNAGQAFSMPRLSSHFMLYQVSDFRFFIPSDQDFVWKKQGVVQKTTVFIQIKSPEGKHPEEMSQSFRL